MNDGIYTHVGISPLSADDERDNQRPVPLRRVLFIWSMICFGAALAGMTISGLVKRGRRRVA